MYYKRKIQQQVENNLKNNKAIIITGMRRVGKTTLLKDIFNTLENKIWFDFENPLDIKYFEDIDYNNIYNNIINKGGLDKKRRIFVFVDEVQNFPEISKIAKYLIDHYEIKFILTGSASYYLKNLFPESLAGRKIIFELFPLDFEEFLVFKNEDINKYLNIGSKDNIQEVDFESYSSYYREFIEWGGFPEAVLAERNEQKKDLLEDIFSSYIKNEVKILADYKKNNKIRDLILLLGARVGSQLDLVKLSQELQITRVTVYSYLAFLQATYFIHLVSPYSQSVDREVSGMQKVYFCDNGILKFIARVSDGQLLENVVYNQLHLFGKINYYRKRSGSEIDFIVDKEIAYEVKTTATKSDVNDLVRSLKQIKLNRGFVVSNNYVAGLDNVIFGQFLFKRSFDVKG